MDGLKDDFKWFGEGFDGFPKTLPEDCVEYAIYLIDAKLNDYEGQKKLREVQLSATQLTRKLLKDFIWQRQGFQLELERDKGRSLLHGQTNYGDSVEDEWLIVYILRELSKQHPVIWIRVVDADGQFLLIEAANSLPIWLNPEIADYRVWINEGRLLIIPIDKPGGKGRQRQAASDTLDLNGAIKAIASPTAKILHSTMVENEAFYRLQKYPQQIADSLHYAMVKVPRKLAYVLHDVPGNISAAVEAFYLRDPIALRPLQAKDPSKLRFSPTDCVTVSAKFTKVGYAQLKSQQFSSPPSWAGASLLKGDAKAKTRAELGMKVSCGFEMLISDPQNRDKKAFREITMLLDDVDAGEAHLPTDEDIREWGVREDDESWLDINFEEFERELNGKMRQNMPGGGFGDKGAQDNLRKMVSRFADFLNDDDAGEEGAEFRDDMDNDDDSTEFSESEESDDDDGEAKELSSDEDEFTKMMREMMGMPPDVMKELMAKAKGASKGQQTKLTSGTRTASGTSRLDPSARKHGSEIASEHQEEEEIRQSMTEMEQELREAGALDLDPKSSVTEPPSQTRAIDLGSSSLDGSNAQAKREGTDDHEGADIDANLVKNMLESFKSQGGMAGPGGNLMGLMGMQMPRDEHEED